MHDLLPTTRRLGALVQAVDDADLDAPTPCPDYTVGDLLDHIGDWRWRSPRPPARRRGPTRPAAAREPRAPDGRLATRSPPTSPPSARRGRTRRRGTA